MGHTPMHKRKLYGTATVGTKGQIVIPSEAREDMNIETGDRLYVVGSPQSGGLVLLKEEMLQSIMEEMTAQVESIRALTKNNNS